MSDTKTAAKDRIRSLDLLRGFALLGILIMNISSFADVGIGYLNPTQGAGIAGVDGWLFGFSYLFADTRFMSIFSILFGAGVVLFSDNIIRKNLSAAKYHYRRMFFLLLFGLLHAYLIWMGDILVAYAICGGIIFLLRNKSIKTLSVLALVLFSIPILISSSLYLTSSAVELSETFNMWNPPQAKLDYEINTYRGSWLEQMPLRAMGAIELQTFVFVFDHVWRILSMMLLGVILYRNGILVGNKSKLFYRKLAYTSLSAGLVLSAIGLFDAYARNWNGGWYMSVGQLYNYVASLLMAIGYIGLVVLWSKSTILPSFSSRLQTVGRMAMTNYILMSVICTWVFYGHGLGLFATMSRSQQGLVVMLVWLFLLCLSPFLLKHYRQGPLEWLWRKLTYGFRTE